MVMGAFRVTRELLTLPLLFCAFFQPVWATAATLAGLGENSPFLQGVRQQRRNRRILAPRVRHSEKHAETNSQGNPQRRELTSAGSACVSSRHIMIARADAIEPLGPMVECIFCGAPRYLQFRVLLI
jgi:hypothetical protein